jgi:hypothetical protein
MTYPLYGHTSDLRRSIGTSSSECAIKNPPPLTMRQQLGDPRWSLPMGWSSYHSDLRRRMALRPLLFMQLPSDQLHLLKSRVSRPSRLHRTAEPRNGYVKETGSGARAPSIACAMVTKWEGEYDMVRCIVHTRTVWCTARITSRRRMKYLHRMEI